MNGFGPVVDGVILPNHPFNPTAPQISKDKQMNLPVASGRGIMMDYKLYFSPQAAGN